MKKLLSSLLAVAFLIATAGAVSADSFTDKLQYGQDSNGLYYLSENKEHVYCYDMSCIMSAKYSDPMNSLLYLFDREALEGYLSWMPDSFWYDVDRMAELLKK